VLVGEGERVFAEIIEKHATAAEMSVSETPSEWLLLSADEVGNEIERGI
jgi:hypothetical protein